MQIADPDGGFRPIGKPISGAYHLAGEMSKTAQQVLGRRILCVRELELGPRASRHLWADGSEKIDESGEVVVGVERYLDLARAVLSRVNPDLAPEESPKIGLHPR